MMKSYNMTEIDFRKFLIKTLFTGQSLQLKNGEA